MDLTVLWSTERPGLEREVWCCKAPVCQESSMLLVLFLRLVLTQCNPPTAEGPGARDQQLPHTDHPAAPQQSTGCGRLKPYPLPPLCDRFCHVERCAQEALCCLKISMAQKAFVFSYGGYSSGKLGPSHGLNSFIFPETNLGSPWCT